ncbi:hypothetical protein [Dyella acidiphila]|uniref:DUF2884 family protein n=1 Tax=Dyella acidiphila TaxID=2775866 RepID=A0ABR9GAY6_9GAMM|nr:hypothetical protein [Dyella acidiphila]MBE1161208.1 hypothetical protein [Dyella acidiphila]
MKYCRTALLFALCVAASGCNVPQTTMANGAVTYGNDLVSLHIKDAPDAVINASGDLQVGDKVVSVDAAQRGLLMLYYQNVHDVNHTGREMGKIGAKMGGRALKDKMQGKSEAEQDKDAQAGSDQIKTLAQKMCQDEANIKAVQDQLGAQLADFKPYAGIFDQHEVKSCADDDKD